MSKVGLGEGCVVEKRLTVLSLFDGMSCGQIALNRAGIPYDNYFASEIDKHAIGVCINNFPGTIQLGDIRSISYVDGVLSSENGEWYIGEVDLLIGGSPCQSISNLGDCTGLEGKSSLFFEWLRIRAEVQPSKWLLENVKGNKLAIATITELVGGYVYEINSNNFSAQNRKRLYWVSEEIVPFPAETCRDVVADILETDPSGLELISPARTRWLNSDKGAATQKKGYSKLDPEKASCLTARSDASWNSNYVTRGGVVTRLSPVEYERLQTVPDNYTASAPTTRRYQMLGNGWTVDVIVHILKQMYKGESHE